MVNYKQYTIVIKVSKGHAQKTSWQVLETSKEICDLGRVLEMIHILSKTTNFVLCTRKSL